MALLVGASSRVINCEIGDGICGQLHHRKCEYIRDNLEANAMYISDGKLSVLIVSLDLIFLERRFVKSATELISSKTKIPAKNILLCCTHTHEGPYTYPLMFDAPVDENYMNRLKNWLTEVAEESVKSAKPAMVGSGLGQAHVGFNRRVCWTNGRHTMYGDTSQPGFNGLEGPDDPRHAVLFALDEKKELIAILHNNTSHATCMEAANFASADFPGSARAKIRKCVGRGIPVLYLQGASGDVSPWNLLKHSTAQRKNEQRNEEMGELLAGETMRLIYDSPVCESPVLGYAYEDLKIAVRIPSEEERGNAKKVIDMGLEKAGRWDYVLNESKLRLYKEFKDDPFDIIPVHTVRIGNLAIATNPFEFYCQFGLDIKRRSPAQITIVSQLTNAAPGYCPTIPSIMGGGYSGETIYWCRMEPYCGYKVVEKTEELLYGLWK